MVTTGISCSFSTWMMENEIFDSIVNGNIIYELCRPVNIYNMWFSRSIADRLSRAVLRCFPILIISLFLPLPYGLSAPAGLQYFLLFLITLALGLAVTVSFCMLVYVLTFFTISPQGLRILFTSSVEFFAGAIIPLPFFQKIYRKLWNCCHLHLCRMLPCVFTAAAWIIHRYKKLLYYSWRGL